MKEKIFEDEVFISRNIFFLIKYLFISQTFGSELSFLINISIHYINLFLKTFSLTN